MDISGAHIDSTIYIGEAGLEYAERLASLGARVSVPTTSEQARRSRSRFPQAVRPDLRAHGAYWHLSVVKMRWTRRDYPFGGVRVVA